MEFCTTGVLLERLIREKSLAGYTHIILDEVHERDKDMDFLFIIIRMLQVKQASNVKIILMSATIDSHMVKIAAYTRFKRNIFFKNAHFPFQFAKYFGHYQDDHFEPAPIIRVDKENLYTVNKYYLDDLNSMQVSDNRYD